MKQKSIIFDSNEVKAVLEGRKIQTRKLVEVDDLKRDLGWDNRHQFKMRDSSVEFTRTLRSDITPHVVQSSKMLEKDFIDTYAPYRVGDIIFVKETWGRLRWQEDPESDIYKYKLVYRATDEYPFGVEGYQMPVYWNQSTYMKKDEARIWLKILDITLEGIQAATQSDIREEGFNLDYHDFPSYYDYCIALEDAFKSMWHTRTRRKDQSKYGWDANPWVWRIVFERIDGDKNG